MNCQELTEQLAPLLAIRCQRRDDKHVELVLPIQGLDGYNVRFWVSETRDGLSLTDDGHLVESLWGVKRSDIAARVAAIAADLPISVLDDGDLRVDLIGQTVEENSRILSTTMEAVIAAWALRLDQTPPDLSESTRSRIARRLSELDVPYKLGHRIPGRSGYDRYFDIAAGAAATRLLRTTDSGDPAHLKQSAELYAFHAIDIRSETFLELPYRFFWTWNSERIVEPDPRILGILETAEIRPYPSEDVEGIAVALAG